MLPRPQSHHPLGAKWDSPCTTVLTYTSPNKRIAAGGDRSPADETEGTDAIKLPACQSARLLHAAVMEGVLTCTPSCERGLTDLKHQQRTRSGSEEGFPGTETKIDATVCMGRQPE